MKIYGNYRLSSLLGVSHFLTDGIAAFALTMISVNILNANNFVIDKYIGLQVVGYFILYNFLAFFGQMFVGYFLDKIKKNKDYYDTSNKIIIFSFLFYISGTLFLGISYFLAVLFIGIASCLFHLGAGNISLLSNKMKATNLGIFASGGVVGLSFGGFIALFFPFLIILVLISLVIISIYILKYKDYKIDNQEYKKYYEISDKFKIYIPVFIGILAFILIIRSTIWTNFQLDFVMDRMVIFYIALVAFLGKIIGGVLEDNKYFYEKYFIITGIISFISIYIYSFYYSNIILLFIGIFGIQIFVSPITIIIYKLIPNHRSKIIGFTFGMSLILGFLLLKL